MFLPLLDYWIIPLPEEVDTPAEVQELVDFAKEYFAYLRAHTCNLKLKVDGVPVLATVFSPLTIADWPR